MELAAHNGPRRREHPQQERAEKLKQVRRFGDRDGAAVQHVDDGCEQQTCGKGCDERQEPYRAEWAPSCKEEADRKRKVPCTDLVRDVDGRALVAAVDETRHGERELRDGDADQAETQDCHLAQARMSLPPCGREDACGQVGRVRHLVSDRLTQRARILDELPARSTRLEMVGHDGYRERRVLAVEQRRARFTDGAAVHALYVAAPAPEVPKNSRAGVLSIVPVTDDLQLVRSAIAGDRMALATIVRETQDHVWRYCAYLGRGSDTDDLVQDTYLRALRSLRRYEGRSSLRTWMLSIARRVCADAVRSARRRRAIDALFVREHPVSDPGDRIAYALLIDALTPDRREAFVLTQIVGLSYADAAEVCGVALGTIRSRVARARDELHAELAEGTA